MAFKVKYPESISRYNPSSTFNVQSKWLQWESQFRFIAQMKAEYGASGLDEKIAETEKFIEEKLEELRSLPEDPALARAEPNELEAIRALRPTGARRIWSKIDQKQYQDRLEGALIGRCAGCILGAPVEGWPVYKMEEWAEYIGDTFPPVKYWSQVQNPHDLIYKVKSYPRENFTPSVMNAAPPDDDIIYTHLGLLILEDYGPDFTIENAGQAWLKYLPHACTAEQIALNNLKNGVSAKEAASKENPYVQWIGADIRSDPWGYAAPGWPEKAAEFAYKDAYISHRRNGIFSAMYFSAVISAAFSVDDPLDAFQIGLQEIPSDCLFAQEVRWAINESKNICNYKDANEAVRDRYARMHPAHAINNACLTIWGLTIGGSDFTKVISETVAMGYDNDCTAATAGSIAGAIFGKSAIATHWWENFNNRSISYLNDHPEFAFDDLIQRFSVQATRVHREA